MDFYQMLTGGALIGTLAAFWGYIKGFAWKVISLFVQRVDISNALTTPVLNHLLDQYYRSPIYDRSYMANTEQIGQDRRYGLVPAEQLGSSSLILWRGIIPFLLTRTIVSDEDSKTRDIPIGSNITVLCIRGTLNFDTLVTTAVKAENDRCWEALNAKNTAHRRFFVRHVPNPLSGTDSPIDPSQLRTSNVGGMMRPWYQQGYNRLLLYNPDDINRPELAAGKELDMLIFPPPIRALIDEIRRWRNSREWFESKHIPWKRGWLLYGPAGTGKTALARAFAHDLDLPIFVYQLSQLGNLTFSRSWHEMRASAPCIALIEDIDNTFHGRKNITPDRSMNWGMMSAIQGRGGKSPGGGQSMPLEAMDTGKLTFDAFLNALDGIERNDGIFTIITTNDLSKIDAALGQPRELGSGAVEFISTRPGRIDKAIELGYMTRENKLLMAERIAGEFPQAMVTIREFLDANPTLDETPAQFQERCNQIAVKYFWEKNDAISMAAKGQV